MILSEKCLLSWLLLHVLVCVFPFVLSWSISGLLVSGVHHNDSLFLYITKWLPWWGWLPAVTIQRYYNVIDYIPCAALSSPCMYWGIIYISLALPILSVQFGDFNKCIQLWNHQLGPVWHTLITPQSSCCPFAVQPLSCRSLGKGWSSFCLWRFIFLKVFHRKKI